MNITGDENARHQPVLDDAGVGDVEAAEDGVAVHTAALARGVPHRRPELLKLAQEHIVQLQRLSDAAACVRTQPENRQALPDIQCGRCVIVMV